MEIKLRKQIKHMTKTYIIFTLLFFLLIGCGQSVSNPKTILNKYLDAFYHGNYKEAYQHISSEDKKIKDISCYLSEIADSDNPFIRIIQSKTSYEIKDTKESENKAEVNVVLTCPNFKTIMAELMGAAFASSLSGNNNNIIIQEEFEKKYKDKQIPMTTINKTFNLIKESDEWKVFLDWKTEKLKKEKEAKIQALLANARQLRESKKLHGALNKYEKVLELDSEMVEAKKGIEETKKEIKSFDEKQAYTKNVVLYDLVARYYDTYLEKNVPGVEFKLKNKGNRTLKKVRVTVYFKNASGTIIFEKDYHPVLVTKYSFGRDNKPLKPNYIWQMESGRVYKADSVPDEWKEGAVSAKITDIEFAD